MGLEGRIKRLERDAREEMIVIPQRDGTVRRFPQSAARDAFVNMTDRMGAGDDAPPEHPMLEAVRVSSDSKWAHSLYAVDEGWTEPVEDQSE